MKRWRLLAGFMLAVAACHDAPTSARAPTSQVRALSADREAAQGTRRYIVRFRDDTRNVSDHADSLVAAHAGHLLFNYRFAIKGFAAEFSERQVAAIARDPAVLSVQPDHVVLPALSYIQYNPPSWGLERIDQRALPLVSAYAYNRTGAGVRVYIIDSGIWYTHSEFGGRAVKGEDEITPGGSALDCAGHGTHVAGTVGGSSVGVAKGVTLVSVRVLNCADSGWSSEVIAGVDYVTAQKQANPGIPMVANMSLQGPLDTAENAAITSSIAAGVTYVVAAGNYQTDACYITPASARDAITVGATDINDAMASFSDYGTCVEIFAPGVNIYSAWYGSDAAYNTLSGTSQATPHVAGAAAQYLEAYPTATPAAVALALTANATANTISGIGPGSPNLLLYTRFIPAVLSVSISYLPDAYYTAGPDGGVSPYTYYWDWYAWSCPPGGNAPAAQGSEVSPNRIACGWQFFSTDYRVYFPYHQRTLRVMVTSSDGQQAQASVDIP